MHAPYAPTSTRNQSVIRAELSGSNRCSAAGIAVRAHAPVLEICRRLIAAGHDPAARLQAFRGNVLCLTVRSIGEAAKYKINTKGTGLIPFCAVSTASPVRQIDVARVLTLPAGERRS